MDEQTKNQKLISKLALDNAQLRVDKYQQEIQIEELQQTISNYQSSQAETEQEK